MLAMREIGGEREIQRVMLVDDNDDDNFIHSRYLIMSGFVEGEGAIVMRKDGDVALSFVQELIGDGCDSEPAPDLILLDLNMPRMGGFEFLKHFETIRDGSCFQNTKVVVLTSSSAPSDQERSRNFTSVQGFLTKPLSVDALREIVA